VGTVTSLSDKAGFLIVANAFNYGVAFLTPMVLVRLLSQYDYGTYQQLCLIFAFATGIMTLGLPVSVYFFFHHRAGGRGDRPTLIAQTQVMLAVSGVATAAAIAWLAPTLAVHLNDPQLKGLLPLYALYIGLFICGEHFLHVMISQDRYRLGASLTVLETAARVGALIVVLALGFRLHAVVLVLVAYAGLRLLPRSYWLWRGEDSVRRASWRERFPLAQLAYSLPLAATMGVGMLGSMLDRTIVAVAFAPATYAIYSVGALEVPLDSIFQAPVLNVLRASLPPLIKQGRSEEIIRIWRDAVRKLALIVVPAFFFLLVFAGRFITTLFTHRYAASVAVFRIYLFLLPLHMLVLSVVPQVYGRTRLNLYVIATAVALNAALSLLLLHPWGILGPAAALVLSTYVSAALYFIVAMRLLGAGAARLLPVAAIGRTAAAAGLAALAALSLAAVAGEGLASLALGAASFTLCYLGLGYLLGALRESEVHLARRWIRRLMPT
jgi:O-antigen/teichoic acid export membrane protein